MGLTNVLAGQVPLGDAIQPSGSDGLYFLASGPTPPNPSELLGSSRMGELIAAAQGDYDKIVLDTPPVLPVADAAVTSSYAEAVVFVLRHGRTSRAQVANAAAALDNVDARVVGSVISMKKTNRAERRRYGQNKFRHAVRSTDPSLRPPRPVESTSKLGATRPAPVSTNGSDPHGGDAPTVISQPVEAAVAGRDKD